MSDFYITHDLHKIVLHTIWRALLVLTGQSAVKCDTIFLSSIKRSVSGSFHLHAMFPDL